jgi:hypothetical protein
MIAVQMIFMLCYSWVEDEGMEVEGGSKYTW